MNKFKVGDYLKHKNHGIGVVSDFYRKAYVFTPWGDKDRYIIYGSGDFTKVKPKFKDFSELFEEFDDE